MTVLAILAVIVLALLAAVLRVAGRVAFDEGRGRTGDTLTLLAAGFAALAVAAGGALALGW